MEYNDDDDNDFVTPPKKNKQGKKTVRQATRQQADNERELELERERELELELNLFRAYEAGNRQMTIPTIYSKMHITC